MSKVIVRELRDGEEVILRGVFYSAVHDLAATHYTAHQLSAWAPEKYDARSWTERMRSRRTFVAEEAGEIAGYCALREDGYVDHLYVSGPHARHGVGTALLEHLDRVARDSGITALASDVSLCAEPFFVRHGFSVLERRTVVVRGVTMTNKRMQKDLAESSEAAAPPASR
jgi:putative acetyltransferase